jgi:uncharacterized iron-regulated protein
MNNIYRVSVNCPICNDYEEAWIYNGKIAFANTISCRNCSTTYTASDYITSFLDLRTNVTVSCQELVNNISC